MLDPILFNTRPSKGSFGDFCDLFDVHPPLHLQAKLKAKAWKYFIKEEVLTQHTDINRSSHRKCSVKNLFLKNLQ